MASITSAAQNENIKNFYLALPVNCIYPLSEEFSMQTLFVVYVPNLYLSIHFTDISSHSIFYSDLLREGPF